MHLINVILSEKLPFLHFYSDYMLVNTLQGGGGDGEILHLGVGGTLTQNSYEPVDLHCKCRIISVLWLAIS